MKNRTVGLWLLVGMLVLSACTLPADSTTPGVEPVDDAPIGLPGTTQPQATVDAIQVLILESFPVQVHVQVEGWLPESCSEIGAITQRREDDTFWVEIGVTRPADALCAQVLTPFTATIALDVEGLPAGTYTVDVNGARGSFALAVENAFSDTPRQAPLAQPRAAVETVQVLMLESLPAQINVVINGMLPESCAEIGNITQRRDGDTFWVEVGVTRPADALCAQVLTPFEQVVALEAVGLPAGTYTVDVNGVRGSFTLAIDNVLNE